VWGSGFNVRGEGFGLKGLRVYDSRCGVEGLQYRAWGS
jgi:hypothetical protein